MTWYFDMKLEILTTECSGTGLGSQQQHEFLPHTPLVHFVGLSKYLISPDLVFSLVLSAVPVVLLRCPVF